MLKHFVCACACVSLMVGGLRAQTNEQDFVATSRKTLQKYEKAVITLSAVLKIEARGMEGMGEQERKAQCPAVVIDASGLAVASLTTLNPHGKIRAGTRTLELDCQVQEVKYKLNDGTELPARVVLKDEDLDLAFLALQKPLDDATRAQLAYVPLNDAASQVQAMDSTISLARASEELNYAPLLLEGRILAVLSQPRSCFVADGGIYGMPVFDSHGKLIGVVCRCVKSEGSSEGTLRTQTVPTRLVLPTADIARLVPQAKDEAKKAAEADKKPGKSKKKASATEKKTGGEKKNAAEKK